MKVTVQSEALAAAIKPTVRIASRRPILPVFGCVHLNAHKSRNILTLTATDGDQRLTVEIPAQIHKSGEVCVNADMLNTLAARAEGEIMLELQEKIIDALNNKTALHVQTSAFKTKLNIVPASEFPDNSPSESFQTLEIENPEQMHNSLNAVRFAAHTDQASQYLFCSVALRLAKGSAQLIATDRKRGAVATVPLDYTGEPTTAIIPTTAAATIGGLLESAETATIELHGKATDPTAITVAAGNITYSTKLIGGIYPDIAQAIPSDLSAIKTAIALETTDLKKAFTLCQPFANQDGRVDVSPQGHLVNLSAISPDTGEITTTAEADIAGDFQPFALNVAFILQAIIADGQQQICIHQNDRKIPQQVGEPLTPHSYHFHGRNAVHSIMPLSSN